MANYLRVPDSDSHITWRKGVSPGELPPTKVGGF